jgi:hypothetical protein
MVILLHTIELSLEFNYTLEVSTSSKHDAA